jgi:hypothetical protein
MITDELDNYPCRSVISVPIRVLFLIRADPSYPYQSVFYFRADPCSIPESTSVRVWPAGLLMFSEGTFDCWL